VSAADPEGFSAGHRYRGLRGRTVTAAETLERITPFLGSFGVTRLADVTGLDHVGIPVVQAVRPNSRSLSVSQGKGSTLEAAMVSAAMEAVEFERAENVDAVVHLASWAQLRSRGAPVVDVDLLARRQGSRFNEHLRIPWITGTGLISGDEVLVPLEMVDMDMTTPRPYLTGCFYGGSNGLASGNCREEAILHGLCEVVERDANALWWNRPERFPDPTRLDTDSVGDAELVALIDHFAAADVGLFIWDMTSDLGVAAFSATAIDESMGVFRKVPVVGGHGCHPDRGIALRRAVTEVAQARITAICASRDDISRASMEKGTDGAATAALAAHLRREPRPADFAAVPDHVGSFVEQDLELVLGRIAETGLPEPVMVDLTDSESAIPVVKVIAPGLEPNPAERTLAGPRLRSILEAG